MANRKNSSRNLSFFPFIASCRINGISGKQPAVALRYEALGAKGLANPFVLVGLPQQESIELGVDPQWAWPHHQPASASILPPDDIQETDNSETQPILSSHLSVGHPSSGPFLRQSLLPTD